VCSVVWYCSLNLALNLLFWQQIILVVNDFCCQNRRFNGKFKEQCHTIRYDTIRYIICQTTEQKLFTAKFLVIPNLTYSAFTVEICQHYLFILVLNCQAAFNWETAKDFCSPFALLLVKFLVELFSFFCIFFNFFVLLPFVVNKDFHSELVCKHAVLHVAGEQWRTMARSTGQARHYQGMWKHWLWSAANLH